jgi:hypothetical protein
LTHILLTHYCAGDKTKKNDVGEACSTNGLGERRVPGFWWENLWERNPGVDGRIILRHIFRKWDVGVWNELSWLRIETGGGHL